MGVTVPKSLPPRRGKARMGVTGHKQQSVPAWPGMAIMDSGLRRNGEKTRE